MSDGQPDNNDKLDPLKIRKDVAPSSESRLQERQDQLKKFTLGRNVFLGLLVAVLATSVFWYPDSRPSKEEVNALPDDQITIYSEPLGAKISKSSTDNQGNFLGKTGEPLLLKELIPHFGTDKEPATVNLVFVKDGFKPKEHSLKTMELRSRIWPQPGQKMFELSSNNPISYLWYYLRKDRPILFGLSILSLLGAGFFLFKCREEQAWKSKRDKLREMEKEKDPLTGLSVLGHQILFKRGKGANSVVYEGIQERNFQTRHAVRFSREDVIDDDLVSFWERESGAYTKMEHPNVIKVFDAKRFDNTFVFVMELIEGKDLRELFDEKLPLEKDRCFDIFENIAAGLDHAHSKQIIHRDVKPANVMIRDDGSAVIVDFGLATDKETNQITATVMIKGTPSYMSPEQVINSATSSVGPGTDQFGLGLMLYEALSGAFPYDCHTLQARETIFDRLQSPPQPFKDVAPDFGEKANTAIMKMLEFDPMNRYKSCTEAVQAVKDAINNP